MNMKRIILTAISVIAVGPALATSVYGVAKIVRVNETPTNTTRVSIYVTSLYDGAPAPTACPAQGWYAYEYSKDADAGNAQLKELLTTRLPFDIEGSNVCDSYGVEGVNYIDWDTIQPQ